MFADRPISCLSVIDLLGLWMTTCLDSSGLEIGVRERNGRELCGAHGGLLLSPGRKSVVMGTHVIIGVGEDDGPRISDPLVELAIRLDDWVPSIVNTHPDLTNGSVGLYRQL